MSWLDPTKPADDWNHTLGRGQSFGANKRHPLRYVFSSVFNASPVHREGHSSEIVNDFNVRCTFVNLAIEAAFRAQAEGRIELLERDHLFLKLFRPWRENPNKPKLLTNIL